MTTTHSAIPSSFRVASAYCPTLVVTNTYEMACTHCRNYTSDFIFDASHHCSRTSPKTCPLSASMEPRSTALAHLNYSVTCQGIERSSSRPEGQRPPKHCRTSVSRNQFDILSLDVSLYSVLYIGTYISLANIDVDAHLML